MTPRKGSTSSEGSDGLPDISTFTGQKRKNGQDTQSKPVLSPARAGSGSQTPKSRPKRTETPKSAAKSNDKTITRSAKKRRTNNSARINAEEEDEDAVVTVAYPRHHKKRIVQSEEEEEEEIQETQQQTQNSSIGKLSTAKTLPHLSLPPPQTKAPLSACSVASAATITDDIPTTNTIAEAGPSVIASTHKKIFEPNPLKAIASNTPEARVPSHTTSFTRAHTSTTPRASPETVNVQQPNASAKLPGKAALSTIKGSSGTIGGTPTVQSRTSSPSAPTPPPPACNDDESLDINDENVDTQRSVNRPTSSAGSMGSSEFSWHADNVDSLARKQQCEDDLNRLTLDKGKQRQVESEDELEDSEKEGNGREPAQVTKTKPASRSAKNRQPKADDEMQIDNEGEDNEDAEQLQAPPSAQQRHYTSIESEEDELSEDEVRANEPTKGKSGKQATRRGRGRDSGYVTSSNKPDEKEQAVEREDSDSSLKVTENTKPKSTRPVTSAQARSNRTRAIRGAQANTSKAKMVEQEDGETTEVEDEEEADQEPEEKNTKPHTKPATRNTTKGRPAKGQTTREIEAQQNEDVEEKPLDTEETSDLRKSSRRRNQVNYAPQVNKKGNPIQRNHTSESNLSISAPKSKAKPAEAGIATHHDKGKDKEIALDKRKAKEKEGDWDKDSEKSSQSTSKTATRASRRSVTKMKVGDVLTSIDALCEAAKETLQHQMYNLDIFVYYTGAVTKVPYIDIRCANGVAVPKNRASGCNARVTATARAIRQSDKPSSGGETSWRIDKVQDDHCGECKDYELEKSAEIDEAEKAAFESAQKELNNRKTLRKFLSGSFEDEDFERIEGVSKSNEGSLPLPVSGPSNVSSRRKSEQKTVGHSKPEHKTAIQSKPVSERVENRKAEDAEEGEKVDQEAHETGAESDDDVEAATQTITVQSIFKTKSQPPAKKTYGKVRGIKQPLRSRATISDSESSSIPEIASHSNSGFPLQRAGASLLQTLKQAESPPKSTNRKHKEIEEDVQVEIPQTIAPAEKAIRVDDSSDAIPPPSPFKRRPPPSKATRQIPGISKVHSDGSSPKASPIEVPKPRSRLGMAQDSASSSTTQAQVDPAKGTSVVPTKRPPSSQGLAKRTGKRARHVRSSSDAEEDMVLEEPRSKQRVETDHDKDKDDDEGSEESSQEEPRKRKTAVIDKKLKGKVTARSDAPVIPEASSSRTVQEVAVPQVTEGVQAAPAGAIRLNTELSALSLAPEMLEALQMSSGLLVLEDILSEIRIRAASSDSGVPVNINSEIMKIITKSRAIMFSDNFEIGDEEALAVCRREDQMLAVARAAFILRKAVYSLPAGNRIIEAQK